MSDWALKRQWRIFTLKPLTCSYYRYCCILLIPMSIGLYQQFDLHPEKIVNGKHGVSGLRFFYWSQSFGRITGESPWKNDVNISFPITEYALVIPALDIPATPGIGYKYYSACAAEISLAAAAGVAYHRWIPAGLPRPRLIFLPVATLHFCCLSFCSYYYCKVPL